MNYLTLEPASYSVLLLNGMHCVTHWVGRSSGKYCQDTLRAQNLTGALCGYG